MQHDNGSILAFVHIEKCGGTSLIDVLRRTFVLNHADVIPADRKSMLFTQSDLSRLLRLRPSLVSMAGHSIRIHAALDGLSSDIKYYTCLRDPIKRYLSDYCYHVERLGISAEFEQWLERDDRHNFQTRAIAGEPSIEKAKQTLDTKFSLIGLLEDSEDFFARLSVLTHQNTGHILKPTRGILNSRSPRDSRLNPQALFHKYGSRIEAANEFDIELYRHAATVTVPAQKEVFAKEYEHLADERYQVQGALVFVKDLTALAVYRVYRNLVYKPYMGRWPGPHGLPIYNSSNITSLVPSVHGPSSDNCVITR